jgi:type II secretory ATPase GspE/PulE/Tfp pilus assembly ATPase PilB-like protein
MTAMQNEYRRILHEIFLAAEETGGKETVAHLRSLISEWERDNRQGTPRIADLIIYLADNTPFPEQTATAIAKTYNLAYAEDLELEPSPEETVKAGIIEAVDNAFVVAKDNHGKTYIVAMHPYVFTRTGEKTNCIATRAYILKMLARVVDNIVPRTLENPTEDTDGFFRHILQIAILLGSSDIHIEYYDLTQETKIKIRRDGFLFTIYTIPNAASWYERFSNVMFVRANINAGEFHTIHDQQLEIQTLRRNYALRLSVIPVLTHSGSAYPQFCYRVMVNEDSQLNSLSDLGFYEDTQKKLYRLIKSPNGIIYITGPTGSGKNTTLYALLQILIDEDSVKILSIEDPVEKRLRTSPNSHAGIIQVEVAKKRNIDFASALRSFLRHDPDVIFIGETRDQETAKASIQAAITGHLVFSTLHTNTAFDVIPRLVGTLEVDKDLLATSLRGVFSQRLIRRVCKHCSLPIPWGDLKDVIKSDLDGIFRKKYFYRPEILEEFDPLFSPDTELRLPIGCKRCKDQGYSGRVAMSEVLIIGHENKTHLFGDNPNFFMSFAANESEPMFESALRIVRDGISTIDEVSRFVNLTDNIHFQQERNKLQTLREFEGAAF